MPDNRLVCSYVRSTRAITSKEAYGQTGSESDRSATARGRTTAEAQGVTGGSRASAWCHTPIGQRLGETACRAERSRRQAHEQAVGTPQAPGCGAVRSAAPGVVAGGAGGRLSDRSEERRVGKECRSRWSP